jgi:hypothetical protein
MATVDILIIRGVVEEKRTNGEEEELVPGAGRCVELIHQGSGRFVRLQLHKKRKKKNPNFMCHDVFLDGLRRVTNGA